MEGAILLVAMLSVFIFGFYMMKRLDSFLEENDQRIQKENETKEPSCVILTNELSDEEIMKEIQRFRARHAFMNIILCDGENDVLSKHGVCQIDNIM